MSEVPYKKTEFRRCLILVVAYESERHIGSLLDLMPSEFFHDDAYRILVIDDCSSDNTAGTAAQWAQQRQAPNIVVLKGLVNLGYGGNQKLGYRYAIDHGFDEVVMLHGDAQYKPENIAPALRLMREMNADVVLGTRMHSLMSAKRGGMPIYKIVGNTILTSVQNYLTGQSLSEFHTGFRAYSTSFLKTIPFELNANGFHFDTEILLQAFHVLARIKEFPISTHYGDEICRVDGMKYAWEVIKASLEYWSHRRGFVCSLRYPRMPMSYYSNKLTHKGSTHALALEELERHRPQTILDIGSGVSLFGVWAKLNGAKIVGVDCIDQETGFDQYFKVDLESASIPVSMFEFDSILLLDVVEHLAKPEEFLLKLRNAHSPAVSRAPRVLISTPNVAFIVLRILLLFGRFNYAERGILDVTHKRLFTRKSFLKMLDACGYDIERFIPVAVPFELIANGPVARVLGVMSRALARVWPSGFSFQFFVVAIPRRTTSFHLRQAQPILGG